MEAKVWIAVTCLIGVAYGVDEHALKKVQCFEPKPAKLDTNWLLSVKMWYNPLSNKMDIYRVCRELLRVKAEEIPEYDIYYEACLTYHMNPKWDGFAIRGFDGHEIRVKLTPTDKPDTHRIQSDSIDYKLGINGTSTVILTDNKTYIMCAICDRNVMVWRTLSTVPSLDAKTTQIIFQAAADMGFYRENFVMIKYDYCPKPKL